MFGRNRAPIGFKKLSKRKFFEKDHDFRDGVGEDVLTGYSKQICCFVFVPIIFLDGDSALLINCNSLVGWDVYDANFQLAYPSFDIV